MKKIIFAILITATLGITSCKKDAYDAGTTTAATVANGWWCTAKLGGVSQAGTFFLSTYNTAANKDSIWVDDIGHFYNFKCKAAVNLSTMTFGTTSSQNDYYNITVSIANGKVLSKAGHSKSGIATDSIYMETKFSDDPTSTYIISGTARTGLVQDDY